MNGLITVQREARGASQIVIFIPVGKLLKFYNDQYNIYAGHEHFSLKCPSLLHMIIVMGELGAW